MPTSVSITSAQTEQPFADGAAVTFECVVEVDIAGPYVVWEVTGSDDVAAEDTHTYEVTISQDLDGAEIRCVANGVASSPFTVTVATGELLC